jgi:hypothetical protein
MKDEGGKMKEEIALTEKHCLATTSAKLCLTIP